MFEVHVAHLILALGDERYGITQHSGLGTPDDSTPRRSPAEQDTENGSHRCGWHPCYYAERGYMRETMIKTLNKYGIRCD